MRYIDKARVNCPEGWNELSSAAIAAEAAARTAMLSDIDTGKDEKAARKTYTAVIDANGDVWRVYKAPLKQLSHQKCWYCEVSTLRADGAVDHFRPKSLYPWSAFRSENFRYACTYCNSVRKDEIRNVTEGKGNSFPLLDESKRAKRIEDEAGETPLLLDPCSPRDPGLIVFQQDGNPVPKFSENEDFTKYTRAKKSIELYHLREGALKDARLELQAHLREKIKEANDIYPNVDRGDPIVDRAFDGLVNFIARAIQPSAEFSIFARSVVSGHRELLWVEALLQTA